MWKVEKHVLGHMFAPQRFALRTSDVLQEVKNLLV